MDGVLRFGSHELRSAQRELRRDGAVVPIGTRAFDLLVALAERRDRIVTKAELLDLVWPGLVVEENNLQVQIGTLRKLLGASAIATIPGRGYRLTIPMATAQAFSATGCTSSAPAPDRPATNLPACLPALTGRDSELPDLQAAGHADRWYARYQSPRRQATEARTMELALSALVSAFGVGETDRLRSDGARLTDAAADELAVALLRQTTEASEAPAGSAP